MSDALRDYKRLPISQRITFVRASVTLQQATTSPIPHPYANLAGLDTLTTTAEETDSQITALETQLRTLRALRVTQVDAVITEFENNVRHIESDSKGEASMIIACGLAIAGAHAPAGAMTQPQNFTVTASDNEGAADWHCDPVAGFTTMEVESTTTPDNPAGWVLHEPVTTSRGTITGLASGVRRYFRVRARSSKGAGPWSDIAWRMVP